MGGNSSILTVICLGSGWVWARSSIKISKEAEMRVIGCDVTDTEGVYSNEKVVRMSEVGILALGKSEVMKG